MQLLYRTWSILLIVSSHVCWSQICFTRLPFAFCILLISANLSRNCDTWWNKFCMRQTGQRKRGMELIGLVIWQILKQVSRSGYCNGFDPEWTHILLSVPTENSVAVSVFVWGFFDVTFSFSTDRSHSKCISVLTHFYWGLQLKGPAFLTDVHENMKCLYSPVANCYY